MEKFHKSVVCEYYNKSTVFDTDIEIYNISISIQYYIHIYVPVGEIRERQKNLFS